MKKSSNHNIDGFIARRQPTTDAPQVSDSTRLVSSSAPRRDLASEQHSTASALGETGLVRGDITASLAEIDDPVEATTKSRKHRRFGRPRWLSWKRIIVILAILLLAGGIFFVAKVFIANSKVLNGNVFGFLQMQALKQDANGRTNILLFGTSEDDTGHDAPYLTDSLMVISLDQKNHDAYTFNIPRDLWVKYPSGCDAGTQGRINVIYQCISDDGKNEQAGASALQATVSQVTGLDIQYYAHLNYTVVRDAVDAVGGVDVDIQGNGPVPDDVQPGSVLDRNFDWRCNKTCFYVKYSPGVHHLDGEHALALARARGDVAPTYGFAQSNYDREKNQQKIAKALVAKALSVGTLANPTAVLGLIDAMGNNLRTNIDTAEIRTFIDIAQKTPADKIQSISLVDADPAIIGSETIGGASVQVATSGPTNYSSISNFLKKRLSSDPVVREQPVIEVFNGGAPSGSAQKLSDQLEAKGYTASYGNTNYEFSGSYELYNLTNGKKSASKAALEAQYGAVSSKTLPVTASDGVDFVIIVGSGLPASTQ